MKKSLLLLGCAVIIIFSGCLGREKSRRSMSMSNLKQISLALVIYAQDNKDLFPTPPARGKNGALDLVAGFDLLVRNEYLVDMNVYIAPYDTLGKVAVSAESFDPVENCSYVYTGHGFASGCSPDVPIAFEKPWRLPSKFDKIVVAFANGSVREFDIPGVSSKSCREIVDIIICQSSSISGKEQALLRKNAELADKLR